MAARPADFAALGIAPGTSVDAAKSAFKRLALVHHPDKGGSAAKFREISSAFSAIAEAAGRIEEADALLADPLADILGANWARGFADGSVDPMQAMDAARVRLSAELGTVDPLAEAIARVDIAAIPDRTYGASVPASCVSTRRLRRWAARSWRGTITTTRARRAPGPAVPNVTACLGSTGCGGAGPGAFEHRRATAAGWCAGHRRRARWRRRRRRRAGRRRHAGRCRPLVQHVQGVLRRDARSGARSSSRARGGSPAP